MSELPKRVCGWAFGERELEIVQRQIRESEPAQRAEIARRVCQALGWKDTLGQAKLMSCRVALLRLHRGGWIELPAPRNGNGNGKALTRQRRDLAEEAPVSGSVEQLDGLSLEAVQTRGQSALWNGLIERYHYLGYSPLPGAQLRYLIGWKEGILGAIGFGAAAWKVASRERFIGWDSVQREQGLARVLNNSRFLVLPWVQVKNLASRVLALSARRLARDFPARYGIEPVLLESFVERDRFRGTCYRAANWVQVGQTRGRGKCDRKRTARLPIKDVYLYPLKAGFRQALGVRA